MNCPPGSSDYCRELEKLIDKSDSLDTKIYIVSGVLGGVSLALIISLLALGIQLHRLRQQIARRRSYRSQPAQMAPAPSGQRSAPPGEREFRDTTAAGGNLQRVTSHVGGHGQNPHQQNQIITQQQSHSQVLPFNSNNNKGLSPAEDELAQLGFSAYTGHQQESRGFSPNAGAVRVLPRNPPTGFRQNSGFHEGYM